VRCFIAITVRPPAWAAAAALLSEARCSVAGVRWVDAGSLHVTLNFLGDVPRAIATDAMQRLEGMALPAFNLSLGGLGQFPEEGDARVLWLGVAGNNEALDRLFEGVNHAVMASGLTPAPQPFLPHCTVGRPRRGWDRGLWLQQFGDFATNHWRVDTIHLYETRDGYRVITAAPLKG